MSRNVVSLILFYVSLLIVKMASSMEYLAPSLFLNHGAGPDPVLGEKNNSEIAESLKNVSTILDLERVKAIIVVTAHREENIVTISSGNRHPLLFDYYNFPPESYKFKYNAPGEPDLAKRLHDAFGNAGIMSKLDDKRGWDHGVFIPMMLVNPAANIPVVQVSILQNQDPKQHYEIGQVLYEFRKESVAIIGSGMSYHNMSALDKALISNDGKIVNEVFDDFLTGVCTGDLEMRKGILTWRKVPGALNAHPLDEADHLMPLIVNAGAGGSKPGKKIFESVFYKKFKLSGFVWDEE